MIRILILDDDELFLSTLARNLRSTREMAFDPTPASTAEQALQAVQHAREPFDVFLIDQLLGAGVDGIDVMQQLRRLSPQTEAIILTGNNDPEAGTLAYEAGAYRYLVKPLNVRELILVIRSFQHLRVMTQVAEEAQRAMSIRAVADIVVRGALKLGFERARLWILPQLSDALVGISQAGNDGLEHFAGMTMKLSDSPYTHELLNSSEPLFFHGQELGETHLHRRFGPTYKEPQGDWVLIPLWSDRGCQGMLSLDNAAVGSKIPQDQRTILSLFGRQVAAALERAQLQSDDARKTSELEVLTQIGTYVADRATRIGLRRLLREVRTELSPLIPTTNFMVVLRRPGDGRLEVCLEFENNQLRGSRVLPVRRGLTQHVMQINRPLLLQGGSDAYRHEHGIALVGRPSRCWLGVPLAIDNRVIGAIVVQDYHNDRRFSEQDRRLLQLVARQIAAPIQMLRQKEQERENGRRLAGLHNASDTLLKLAQESDERLWHVVLTLATANYALQFNRAMLFFAEQNGRRFRGQAGIGHLVRAEAQASWERDRRDHIDFGRYVAQLRNGGLPPTPVAQAMNKLVIDIEQPSDAFAWVFQHGRRLKLSAKRAQQRLPKAFVKQFGAPDCAILPLRLHGHSLGIVVVDNIHTRRRLDERPLEQLEQLLTQAALIFDNVRQRRGRDQLIKLNHTVLAQAEVQSLGQTLSQICENAYAVLGADCMLIFPCQQEIAGNRLTYDHEQIGAAGLLETLDGVAPPPDQLGAELASGAADERIAYATAEWLAAEQLCAASWFVRERLRMCICRPVVDDSVNQIVGIMLLGYRSTPSATPPDAFRLEAFLRLSSMAIRSTYARRQLDEMISLSQERGRELDRLRQLLEALSPEPDRKRVAIALLSAMRELVGQADVRIGLILREWMAGADDSDPRERRRMFLLPPGPHDRPIDPQQLQERTDDGLDVGITGWVFQNGETALVPDVEHGEFARLFRDDEMIATQSELDVPIKLNRRVIGVFNAQSSQPNAFNQVHRRILQRLAAAAALALDNVARQEHLRNVLDATQVVIQPTGLQETLRAVLIAARKAAPDVAALTIWYKEPNTGTLRLGPHFGVLHPQAMNERDPESTSLVFYITQRTPPLWEPHVQQNKRLMRRFAYDEQIASVAAFPLRTDNESIGALFFNYRQTHMWSNEERILFPIIAAIAAASIRDALRLEAMRRERDRLDAAIAITEAVGASLDVNETLGKILRTLHERFRNATSGVLLFNSALELLEFTPESLNYYNTTQLEKNSISLHERSIAASLARKSLITGAAETLNEGDVTTNPDYLPAIASTRSQLSVTLMSNAKLLGVLVLEWPFRNAFDDDDIPLIQSIGRQISLAIERARQTDELRVRTIVATHTAWAAEVAHDTNREISRIRQRAYLLRCMPGKSETVTHIAKDIDESAERLVVSTLAGASLPKSPVAIDDWLRRRLPELLNERTNTTRLLLDNLACPEVYVNVPAIVIERVLRHLVRNAQDAMNLAGTIAVHTRQKNDAQVEIVVADTGPGVAEKIRQRLFADIVTTKGDDGGMGLLYAHSAIQPFGGDIVLLPQSPGEGAAFAVLLPLTSITPLQEKER